MNSILILTIIFTLGICDVRGLCPDASEIRPCSCSDPKDESIMVQCTGPARGQQVVSALASIRTTDPWDLQLHSLNLEELPPNTMNVMSLRLINCNLGRLLKSSSMMWPNLNEFVIESARIGGNPWSQLNGAHVLRSVKISELIMRSIGQEFRSLPTSVEYLDLRKTGTTRLENGCMAQLKNLLYIFIADMPLTEFPRQALPDELLQLHTFILGNTLIEKLEPNFFDGMPKLEVLMLNGNKFTTLDSHLFMPLRNHLTHLLAERNHLECDCHLLWLKRNFQHNHSIKVMATCYDNSIKEFRGVMTLNEEEYC